MSHLGIICPVMDGHMNPVLPLAQELKKRGHTVTFFQFADGREKITKAGLQFQAIAERECPLGSFDHHFAQLSQMKGWQAAKYCIDFFGKLTQLNLRYLPSVLVKSGVEGLIIDQVVIEGGTIAQVLKIPFISFTGALMLDREAAIPPYCTGWSYGDTWWQKWRNQLAYTALDFMARKNINSIDSYRRQHGLTPIERFSESFSPLAQISQQPAEFEFPRHNLPPHFYFTGPYHYSSQRENIPFPFEKLDSRPLIYASLGTLQNGRQEIFQTIARACADLPVQLVLSFGNLDAKGTLRARANLPTFPANTIAVPYAPQLELLKRASLAITHAGLNTTLEALSQGVPLVAIPITNDQPAVAARIVWTGVGQKIDPAQLTVASLRGSIEQVLKDPNYRYNALRLKRAIDRSGGVKLAAEIVEKTIITKQLAFSY
jgi:zeaxanthin glucosyltransferase